MANLRELKNKILRLQQGEQNEIFKKNLEILKNKDNGLYNKVASFKADNDYIIVKEKEDTLKNLVNFSKNVVLYDVNEVLKSVANEVDSLKLINSRIAVFLGMGLGYELMYFIEEYAHKQATEFILIVEKDMDMFVKALMSSDLTEIIKNPRVKFIVDCNEEQLFIEYNNYLYQNNKFILGKAVKFIYNFVNLNLFKEYYLKAINKFNESVTYLIDFYGNDPEDSLIGVENMFENIDVIIKNPGINLLYDKFKGKPAVIASTGPSLNKNKHLLKGLQNKALIISPDASLRILNDIGVKPHLITSLERVEATVKLVSGFKKEEVENTYYAACPVIYNDAYKAYPGPKTIVYRNFAHFKWLGVEKGVLDIKKSSGNMAFKIATALGCDPIILIGQDLAFGKDGITHAKGAFYGEKQGKSNNVNLIKVKANDGGVVETKPVWYSFLKDYEVDIAEYEGKCINSTEGGAYIEGTEVMPFEESIKTYIQEEFYPLNIIKENFNNFNESTVVEDYKQVEKVINTAIVDMKYIIEQCEEGFELCKKYENELNKYLIKERKMDVNKIKEIEKKIIEPKNRAVFENYTFRNFFMHIIQSYDIKFQMDMYDLPNYYEDENIIKVAGLLKYKNWYAVVANVSDITLNTLNHAKNKIDMMKI